jgi:hypothetical protein
VIIRFFSAVLHRHLLGVYHRALFGLSGRKAFNSHSKGNWQIAFADVYRCSQVNMNTYISFLFVACFAITTAAGETTNAPAKPPTGNVLYCAYVERDSAGKHGYCFFDPQISSVIAQSRLYPTLASFKKAIRGHYQPEPSLISDPKWYPAESKTRALTKSELEFLVR